MGLLHRSSMCLSSWLLLRGYTGTGKGLHRAGFTVVELLVVLVVLGLLVWVVVPRVYLSEIRSKGLQETQNLRAIEAAKASFSVERPGESLLYFSRLGEYFPSGRVPRSPWGLPYVGADDLSVKVQSQANGLPQYEPPMEPLDANGFNDLALAGYVYLQGPEVGASYVVTPLQVESVRFAGGLGGEILDDGGDPLAPVPSPSPTPFGDHDNGHGNDPGNYDPSNPGGS